MLVVNQESAADEIILLNSKTVRLGDKINHAQITGPKKLFFGDGQAYQS
jgi:hypothetical protein